MKKIALISLFCLSQSFLYSASGKDLRYLGWVFQPSYHEQQVKKKIQEAIREKFEELDIEPVAKFYEKVCGEMQEKIDEKKGVEAYRNQYKVRLIVLFKKQNVMDLDLCLLLNQYLEPFFDKYIDTQDGDLKVLISDMFKKLKIDFKEYGACLEIIEQEKKEFNSGMHKTPLHSCGRNLCFLLLVHTSALNQSQKVKIIENFLKKFEE